ncbi:hypothetical protein DFJ58DRAFT_724072 [Suillus subalutaceus]|uniref:uncharacterized protein n=1 Tax=Suillus subalutaceus TaxID=48586 RepID=UPI001B875E2C|nr:uncharacterized protein DFJ58DRAFT_724072 [Suillus subalutaceus]KAG1866579.1 hypothetical protein DFJ58DRAFT_724072 [Suillus subalutaceus]
MSQMIEPIRRTRAKNATAHPGQIVLDAQQKRQMPKAKAADEKRLKAAQEAKEALAVAGLNRLAELQASMEEAQATTTKPKAGTASASNDDEPTIVGGITTRAQPAREDADKDFLAGDNDSGDDGRKKKGGKNAQSLSTAIVKARKNLSAAKADSRDQPRVNEKGNSLPAKSTLGGRVQNWRKDVYYEPKTTSNSLTSASQVPPSTIFSKSQILHDSTGVMHVNSARKRKQFVDITQGISEEDDLLSPQEEIDDIVYEPASDDEEAMQVDEIEDVVKKPIAVKMQQANTVKVSRTTAATSVGTVSRCDNKVPPSKKAKTIHMKSEHPASTASAGPKGDGNWVELVSKVCSTYLNTDLPPGCHEDGKWARQFLPTVFLWLGAQDELWTITDVKLLHACQEIFKVVFPNIQYKVVTSGSVFGVVTQRVSEWRSNFGSTALAMVVDFLNSNRDTSPQTLAKLFLAEFAFLYPDPENIDKAETFRSAFVQELLTTAHLARIIGHADVPALDTNTLADSGITGALGLCAVCHIPYSRPSSDDVPTPSGCTSGPPYPYPCLQSSSPLSLERAFTLVADNTIVVDDPKAPVTRRKARLKTPKFFNKVTGKEMATEHAFSIAKWGPKTASFIQGANKKGVESNRLTMSMAYKYLKKPGFNNHNSLDSADKMDDRADIW